MKTATLEQLGRVVDSFVDLARNIETDTTETVATRDHLALIRHYDLLRYANERIKEARKALETVEETLSRTHIPDLLRDLNLKTLTVIDVGRVSVSHRYSCSMVDKTKGMDWLRSHGHGGLIQETVNSSSLASFAKNMLVDEGKELPTDLFKVSTMAYTSITKAK